MFEEGLLVKTARRTKAENKEPMTLDHVGEQLSVQIADENS